MESGVGGGEGQLAWVKAHVRTCLPLLRLLSKLTGKHSIESFGIFQISQIIRALQIQNWRMTHNPGCRAFGLTSISASVCQCRAMCLVFLLKFLCMPGGISRLNCSWVLTCSCALRAGHGCMHEQCKRMCRPFASRTLGRMCGAVASGALGRMCGPFVSRALGTQCEHMCACPLNLGLRQRAHSSGSAAAREVHWAGQPRDQGVLQCRQSSHCWCGLNAEGRACRVYVVCFCFVYASKWYQTVLV